MFLRHLRRTRALLHVIDASVADPASDYVAVREELRMYNPEYCARPHAVVLNKIDLLVRYGHCYNMCTATTCVLHVRIACK